MTGLKRALAVDLAGNLAQRLEMPHQTQPFSPSLVAVIQALRRCVRGGCALGRTELLWLQRWI